MQAEAPRLEEARLEALELRVEADLARGHHAILVGELEAVVAEHPLRERLRSQLMLALYRSERQAEALQAYQDARRLLVDELGIEPSRALQHLERAILVQDPALELPGADMPAADSRSAVAVMDGERTRESSSAAAELPGRNSAPRVPVHTSHTRAFITIAVALAVAGAVAAAALVAPSDEPRSTALRGGAPNGPARIGLAFFPGRIDDPADFPLLSPVYEGLKHAALTYGAEIGTYGAGSDPAAFPAALASGARRSDLVVVAAPTMGDAVGKAARKYPKTRFVVLDGSATAPEIGGLPNVTGIRFAEQQAGYLAGYLAGLVEAGSQPRLNRARVVSAIGGQPTPPVQRYLAGFRAGVNDVLPSAMVLIGFSRDFVRQDACERLANHQIDRGSDIVFAVAGICSFGALKAAELRHVWGIGVDGDLSYLGPHILGSAIKREDRAALLAVKWFTQDRLPGGRDIVLDLNANGVGIVGVAGTIPQSIRSQLATIDGKIRAGLITVPSGP